jgi:peptidoglycan/LPS O-acetylase OafA/YrhL
VAGRSLARSVHSRANRFYQQGGAVTPEPVGIVSTRRLAAVATAVRAHSRPRRGNSISEPQSGWVRANFDRFVAIRRFGALDGLRAVSAIAVVWQHTVVTPIPSLTHKGSQVYLGFLGVSLFFAISGFLITSLLLRERTSRGRISLRKFYARRALRIFPLYYATLLVYILYVAAFRRDSPGGIQFFRDLPHFATYTFNWLPPNRLPPSPDPFNFAWSLATEEQFYLLWPPLLVATLTIGGWKRTWPPLVVLAVLIAIQQGVHHGLVGDSSMMPWRIPASLSLPILLGAAAALVTSTRRGFAVVSAVAGRVWSAPVAALLLVVAIAANAKLQITEILMVVLVVATCIVEWTPLHPILRWRPLAFVGVISYGVYMLHDLCRDAVRSVTGEQWGIPVFAVTLVTVVVVAYLSFRFFETPVLKLKRRYETNGEHDGDELSRIAALSRPEVPQAVCDKGAASLTT